MQAIINIVVKLISEIWRALQSKADIHVAPDDIDQDDEFNKIPANWHLKWEDFEPPLAVKQSPHRGGPIHPSMMTIHFTKSDASLDATANYMMNRPDMASYNYLIDNETGEIVNLVHPGLKPFSDGRSRWMDARGNWRKWSHDWTVAVAVCQSGEHPYSEACYESVAKIAHYCMRKFPNFRAWAIAGHEHVAADRKDDPGPNWKWKHFFVKHIGLTEAFWHVFLEPGVIFQNDPEGIISGTPDLDYKYRSTQGDKEASAEKEQQMYDGNLRIFAHWGQRTNRAAFEYCRETPVEKRSYMENGY